MKRILSLSLCLIMLIACVALSACFGKGKDKDKLSYEKVKANLESCGYSIEEAGPGDIDDFSEEIYDDYNLEVEIEKALYAYNYSNYGYVMVAELKKSSNAKDLADAFAYDYTVTYSEGKLAFAASSQAALDDAIGDSHSSNSGYPGNTNSGYPYPGGSSNSDYPSNTNSGYYPDYSSNTNSGYYPDYSSSTNSGGYGDSSYSLNEFYNNLNRYSFLYPENLSSSDISSFEDELSSDYSVYEDIYAAVSASYGNEYIYIIEFYSSSDATSAYNDFVYYDNDDHYVQRDYDILLIASAQYLMECAYSTYSGSAPSNGSSSSSGSSTGNGYKSGDIETVYFSMSEFESNLENYGVYFTVMSDSEEADFVDSFVREYTDNSVYKIGQGTDDYDGYILIIEFMDHSSAVEFYYAAYDDLYNNDVYYIVVRGESVLIADKSSLINYADGSY